MTRRDILVALIVLIDIGRLAMQPIVSIWSAWPDSCTGDSQSRPTIPEGTESSPGSFRHWAPHRSNGMSTNKSNIAPPRPSTNRPTSSKRPTIPPILTAPRCAANPTSDSTLPTPTSMARAKIGPAFGDPIDVAITTMISVSGQGTRPAATAKRPGCSCARAGRMARQIIQTAIATNRAWLIVSSRGARPARVLVRETSHLARSLWLRHCRYGWR